MSLLECPINTCVKIKNIEGDYKKRLREYGLGVGNYVSILQKVGFKGRIIAFRYQRFAISSEIANAISV